MTTYLIERRDGSAARMRLVDGNDPAVEVAKWPDRDGVVKITKVAEFEERPPQPLAAVTATSTPHDIMAALVQVDDYIRGMNARVVELEKVITELKKV